MSVEAIRECIGIAGGTLQAEANAELAALLGSSGGARECICPDCEKVWQEHMQKEFGHAPEPSVEQKIKARDFHYALIEQHGLKDDAVTNSIVRKGLERLAGIAPEPVAKPVPCWCPYCEQPHTPRIQEADPSPPTKPCTCPDTTESACGVARGSQLGKLWHCRRSLLGHRNRMDYGERRS